MDSWSIIIMVIFIGLGSGVVIAAITQNNDIQRNAELNKNQIQHFKTLDCKNKLQILIEHVDNNTMSDEPYRTELAHYELECRK